MTARCKCLGEAGRTVGNVLDVVGGEFFEIRDSLYRSVVAF